MDSLRLKVDKNEEFEFVEVYINDKKFIEILKEIELAYDPKIAGEYIGLPPEVVFLPSKHFFGQPHNWYFGSDGKVPVLQCTCGSPGCWDFLVKITIEEDRVIWSEFEQPHRGLTQGDKG